MVEKKNNSGLMHNDRLMVAVGYETLGYVSKLDNSVKLPFESLAAIPKQKNSIRFDKIVNQDKKENVIDLKFQSKQMSMSEPETWTMRMASDKMAN